MMIENYTDAYKLALKVEFLSTSEELHSYAGALFSAMMWGKEVDEKNKAILKKDNSVE